ncbi:hypothetical protein [Anaplasma phagocytophilum]
MVGSHLTNGIDVKILEFVTRHEFANSLVVNRMVTVSVYFPALRYLCGQ